MKFGLFLLDRWCLNDTCLVITKLIYCETCILVVTVGEWHRLSVNQENENGDKLTYMYPSQSNQASVFGISGIPTCNQCGLDKSYQPWPSAWLVTLTLTLIIPEITKIESHENCFIIHCFEETLYTEPQNTLALLLWKQGDYPGLFILWQD